MAYVSTNAIHIFPTTTRSNGQNIVTEGNIAAQIRNLSDYDGFVVGEFNDYLQFYLGGYKINVSKSTLTGMFSASENIYAGINITSSTSVAGPDISFNYLDGDDSGSSCSFVDFVSAISVPNSYTYSLHILQKIDNIWVIPAESKRKLSINSLPVTTEPESGDSNNLVDAGTIASIQTTLQNNINTVSNNLSTEINTREQAVQDLDAKKQNKISGAAATITSSNLTPSRALISNESGKVAVSDITSTELGYLDGATSNIQTQLDGKQTTLTFDDNPVSGSNNPVKSKGIYNADIRSVGYASTSSGGTITLIKGSGSFKATIPFAGKATSGLLSKDTQTIGGIKTFAKIPVVETTKNARTATAEVFHTKHSTYTNIFEVPVTDSVQPSKVLVTTDDTQDLTHKTYNGYTLNNACARGVQTYGTSDDSTLPTLNYVNHNYIHRIDCIRGVDAALPSIPGETRGGYFRLAYVENLLTWHFAKAKIFIQDIDDQKSVTLQVCAGVREQNGQYYLDYSYMHILDRDDTDYDWVPHIKLVVSKNAQNLGTAELWYFQDENWARITASFIVDLKDSRITASDTNLTSISKWEKCIESSEHDSRVLNNVIQPDDDSKKVSDWATYINGKTVISATTPKLQLRLRNNLITLPNNQIATLPLINNQSYTLATRAKVLLFDADGTFANNVATQGAALGAATSYTPYNFYEIYLARSDNGVLLDRTLIAHRADRSGIITGSDVEVDSDNKLFIDYVKLTSVSLSNTVRLTRAVEYGSDVTIGIRYIYGIL